jgi:hypothetical protein
MTTSEAEPPSVELAADNLFDAMRDLAKLVKVRQHPQSVLGFGEGMLSIEAGGMAVKVPATGVWPGEARADTAFLLGLSRGLPRSQRLRLSVENGRLTVHGASGPKFSSGCIWQPTAPSSIQLPINATLVDFLRVGLEYSKEDIAAAGVEHEVDEARRRATTLVDRAAETLAPLNISKAALAQFVRAQIRAGRAL